MNNQIRTALKALGIAGLFCGAALTGQVHRSEVATVPFAFQVGSAVMPAGTYSAIQTNTPTIVRLENRTTGKAVLAAASIPKAGKGGEGKLAFRCYDKSCFLTEIWYADQADGHALPTNRRERELMASQEKPKLTYVAMR